jgi:magnesium-transporting ATPase (P-type)
VGKNQVLILFLENSLIKKLTTNWFDLICWIQSIHTFVVKTKQDAYTQLNNFSSKKDCCLVIDGNSLQLCLDNYKETFIKVCVISAILFTHVYHFVRWAFEFKCDVDLAFLGRM